MYYTSGLSFSSFTTLLLLVVFPVVEIRIIILLKETDASQVIDWQFH